MRLIAESNGIADQDKFFNGREEYKEYWLIF
jgi:hypothetical protein